MKKIPFYSKEIFRCYWNGNMQPIAIDKRSVQDYIKGTIVDPRIKLNQFKVVSNYGEYEVTKFINS